MLRLIVKELHIFGGMTPCNLQSALATAREQLLSEMRKGLVDDCTIESAQVIYNQSSSWFVLFNCKRKV